ncbi:MAG: hypothetical protein JGK29_22340 [Microcoleus sp. PH2017_17_BER_D_A]|nr:hypothetical protein [Microcoleus sp. PH2017_17_BER_D_A]
MKGFRTFKIFRATSNSQVGKFTESRIIFVDRPNTQIQLPKIGHLS